MSGISKEIAQKEVNKWLDFKKVSNKKREDNADNIEKIVEGLMDGNLVLDTDTFVFEHTLCFPIGEEIKISKLQYQPRVPVKKFQEQMLGLKGEDGYGRVFAFIAGLSGQSKGVISNMESEDYLLASQIAVFFMA